MEILRLSNLSKQYGELNVFRNLNLAIHEGDFLSILGPSGCGKSTLLRIIAELDSEYSGNVDWQNTEWIHKTSIVFQEAQLLPWRNVVENIRLPLELKGLTVDEQVIRQHLQWLGLERFSSLKPHQLSGGIKMRVSLARALITKPKLLLLDEPFAALDELTRERLDKDLRQIWREQNLTVIFVTHSIMEAIFLSSKILTMTEPSLVRSIELPLDRPTEIRWSPQFGAEVSRFSEILRSQS